MAWYNPADPRQRNMMLVGIVLLVLFYPFYEYWYSGKREEVTAMQERLENIEAQNRRARVLAARGGGDLEERMALYERHVTKLEELIPAAEEVAGLFDDISLRARQVGVQPARLIPAPTEPGAFYSRTSYEMSVVGEYHGVAMLLTEIASLSRIVTPVELDMELFNQPDLFPEYESPVVANFRIETYVLPDPDQTMAPDSTAAGGN